MENKRKAPISKNQPAPTIKQTPNDPPIPQDNGRVFMYPVSSSNVKSIGYDKKNLELFVEYKSGATFIYHKVPEDIYNQTKKVDSIGRYVSKNIKNVFESTQYEKQTKTKIDEDTKKDLSEKREEGGSGPYQ